MTLSFSRFKMLTRTSKLHKKVTLTRTAKMIILTKFRGETMISKSKNKTKTAQLTRIQASNLKFFQVQLCYSRMISLSEGSLHSELSHQKWSLGSMSFQRKKNMVTMMMKAGLHIIYQIRKFSNLIPTNINNSLRLLSNLTSPSSQQ